MLWAGGAGFCDNAKIGNASRGTSGDKNESTINRNNNGTYNKYSYRGIMEQKMETTMEFGSTAAKYNPHQIQSVVAEHTAAALDNHCKHCTLEVL